jgi:capsid protein
VLTRLRDLGDYEAALLMKAKIEACLAAVVSECPSGNTLNLWNRL